MQRAHFLEGTSLVNLNLETRRDREDRSRKRNEKECDDTYGINRDDLSSRTLLSFFLILLLPLSLFLDSHVGSIEKHRRLLSRPLFTETVSCETEREKLVAGTCCTDIRHVFRVRCARALVHERQRGEEGGGRRGGGGGIAARLSRYSRICVASRHTISISR